MSIRTAEPCSNCSTFTNAACVIYTGPTLTTLNVEPNTNLEIILQQIENFVTNIENLSTVEDIPFGPSWDGNMNPTTKNTIYDAIINLGTITLPYGLKSTDTPGTQVITELGDYDELYVGKAYGRIESTDNVSTSRVTYNVNDKFYRLTDDNFLIVNGVSEVFDVDFVGTGGNGPELFLGDKTAASYVHADLSNAGENYLYLVGTSLYVQGDTNKIYLEKTAFTATLDAQTLTANRDLLLPDGGGTLALGITDGTDTVFANSVGVIDVTTLNFSVPALDAVLAVGNTTNRDIILNSDGGSPGGTIVTSDPGTAVSTFGANFIGVGTTTDGVVIDSETLSLYSSGITTLSLSRTGNTAGFGSNLGGLLAFQNLNDPWTSYINVNQALTNNRLITLPDNSGVLPLRFTNSNIGPGSVGADNFGVVDVAALVGAGGGGGIGEAPIDGFAYARQNAAWVRTTSVQNNVNQVFTFFVPDFDIATLVSTVNFASPFNVDEVENAFFAFNSTQNGQPVSEIHLLVGLGSGDYGNGQPNQITSDNLKRIENSTSTIIDIELDPNTQFINLLGNLGGVNIEDAFNAHDFSVVPSENPVQGQDEGYVLVQGFINGEQTQWLFVGEGGVYGTGPGATENAVASDFVLLTDIESQATTQIINIPDLGQDTVENVFNITDLSADNPIQDQTDGYVIVNTSVDGVPIQYLFTGPGGDYGLGETPAIADYFVQFTPYIEDVDPINPTWQRTNYNGTIYLGPSNQEGQGLSTDIIGYNGVVSANQFLTDGARGGGIRNNTANGMFIIGNTSVAIEQSNPNNGFVKIGTPNGITAYSDSTASTPIGSRNLNYKPSLVVSRNFAETAIARSIDTYFIGVEVSDDVELANKTGANTFYTSFWADPNFLNSGDVLANPWKYLAFKAERGRMHFGSAYGSGDVTADPATFNLAVDSSGRVIETALGAGVPTPTLQEVLDQGNTGDQSAGSGTFTIELTSSVGFTTTYGSLGHSIVQNTPGVTGSSTVWNFQDGNGGLYRQWVFTSSGDVGLVGWGGNTGFSFDFGIVPDGGLNSKNYGSGSITGTLAYLLGTTSTGQFIEVDPNSIGSSFTYITESGDPSTALTLEFGDATGTANSYIRLFDGPNTTDRAIDIVSNGVYMMSTDSSSGLTVQSTAIAGPLGAALYSSEWVEVGNNFDFEEEFIRVDAANDEITLQNYSIADIDAAPNESATTKEWVLAQLAPDNLSEVLTAGNTATSQSMVLDGGIAVTESNGLQTGITMTFGAAQAAGAVENPYDATILVGDTINSSVTSNFAGGNIIALQPFNIGASTLGNKVYGFMGSMFTSQIGAAGTGFGTTDPVIYASFGSGFDHNVYASKFSAVFGSGNRLGSANAIVGGVHSIDLTITKATPLNTTSTVYNPRFVLGGGTYNEAVGQNNNPQDKDNIFVIMSDGVITAPLTSNTDISSPTIPTRRTGTTTGTTANKLVDSGGAFTSGNYVIEVGCVVYNVTDDTETTITAVDSGTQLSVAADIFTSGEVYEIYAPGFSQAKRTNFANRTLITKEYADANYSGSGATKGGVAGLAIADRDEANYGPLGTNAIDLSISLTGSSTRGAVGTSSIAIGNNATASANSSMVIGNDSTAEGINNIVIGNFASSTSSDTAGVVIGYQATAPGTSAVAIGAQADAGTGDFGVAIGGQSDARGSQSTAVGYNTTANGSSTVVGALNNTGSNNLRAILVGYNNDMPSFGANDAIVIGNNTTAEAGKVLIGGTQHTNLKSRNYEWNIDQTLGAGQDGYVMTYNNSSGELELQAVSAGISNIVEDTTPQLGGHLDVGSNYVGDGTSGSGFAFNPTGGLFGGEYAEILTDESFFFGVSGDLGIGMNWESGSAREIYLQNYSISDIDAGPNNSMISKEWFYDKTRTVDTVANLPGSPTQGDRAFVTDATATTFHSIVAGTGSNVVPVFYDGTNWRIG